ncbi:dnaJ homolog subfamily C member 12-like [Mercenaria mercenaria]|uniref:dnaJ homolog subfamily C member 12-like n=1 Tax=Mercenaria mercenaria TaxID=6596 RepID=UPI001E1D6277|nr:dnaJ homolog subfamily C member 12-like [Mercenaria mercenaria]
MTYPSLSKYCQHCPVRIIKITTFLEMNEGLSNIFGYKPDDNEDYYGILGCDELSSKDQITAEYKARVLHCHPDKHPDDPVKAAVFERIQTAKDVLCDDEKRALYDKWRHAGISMPFKQWCNLRGAVHTSMHWMSPKKESMLEGAEECSSRTQPHPDQTGGQMGDHSTSQSTYISSQLNHSKTGFTDLYEKKVPWKRDEPSEMLRKFRNYEI